MKHSVAFLTIILLLVSLLAGCAGTAAPDSAPQTDKLSIVATIFLEYDWVRQILGEQADRVELTLLLDNGVDLHSYQPTADDMKRLRCPFGTIRTTIRFTFLLFHSFLPRTLAAF